MWGVRWCSCKCFYSWGKYIMALRYIYSDWISVASSRVGIKLHSLHSFVHYMDPFPHIFGLLLHLCIVCVVLCTVLYNIFYSISLCILLICSWWSTGGALLLWLWRLLPAGISHRTLNCSTNVLLFLHPVLLHAVMHIFTACSKAMMHIFTACSAAHLKHTIFILIFSSWYLHFDTFS